MEFALTSEQNMLVDGAARFIRERYSLEHRRAVIAAGGLSEENWNRFADMGWLMLPLPEEAGGIGGSAEDTALLMIEFGRGLVAEPYVTSVLLCGTILAGSANAAQRSAAEQIAAGKLRVALAHDEDSMSLAADADLTFIASYEGNRIHLSGTKRTVLDAPSAHRLIVSATLDGAPALIIVPTDAAGIFCTNYMLVDGTSASDIRFENVLVDSASLIAAGEAAITLLAEGIDKAKLGNLAQAVGSTEAILDICSEYLKTRQQFGRPIGSFQALQHIMAQMFVEAQEARSILYFAIAATRADQTRRGRALAQAQVVIAEAGRIISRQGVQLHGGYGMTEEFAIGHHFKRQLTLEKMFGDGDAHLDALAEAFAA